MTKKISRDPYFRTNKYQKQIVHLTLVPLLILSLAITAFIIFFQKELVSSIHYGTEVASLKLVKDWCLFILISVWTLFLVLVMRAHIISNQLVGAFNRIISELDEILSGTRNTSITARPNDHLVNELLKRINQLVEKSKKEA